MRINQNISALNAYRNMVNTDNRLNKSLERLSSGLRINRAADDAAGLAISEKMRGQIRGLNQAMSNAQDGISLIQTAEGALNETHSILQRMRELSVQAASDTLTSSDRTEIQKEITQLTAEIDRIANTTEFNTKKLLDGTTSALTSTDKLATKVFMRDGLRTIDQFGQKEVGGGNYKLEITADPGVGQVQKTDIMKVKHEVGMELYYYDLQGEIDDVSDEQAGWNVAALQDDVTITFQAADATAVTGTVDVSVATGTSDITITLNTGSTPSVQDIVNEVANSTAAQELIHFEYGDMSATNLAANLSSTSIGGLSGHGEIELDNPKLASGDLEYETITGAFEIAALFDDLELIFIMDNTQAATAPDIDWNAGDRELTVRADENTPLNELVEAILADEDAHALIDIKYNAGASASVASNVFYSSAAGDTPYVTFDLSGPGAFQEIGDVALSNTALNDIDRFWDASGNNLLDSPQTITLVQGNGEQTSFTIFKTDTIGEIETKLNNAIHEGLKQNSVDGTGDGDQYVRYVGPGAATDDGHFSVAGTFVIQSAITGKDGEISFVGDDAVINALSLTTIQQSSESLYEVNVTDAHTGDSVASDVNISGNMLVGEVHANVDVKFDAMAGIEFDTTLADGFHTFDWDAADDAYETFVHLADNTQVFHIGANQLQDIGASIGNMGSEALGIDNILVTDRGSANSAISTIDNAIGRVSGERSKMGALQNRLEHTINNLGVSAENLTAAESRIRDLDFAMEMIEFTRNQIMMQAGTAMLAQANMKPQSVLMLLG